MRRLNFKNVNLGTAALWYDSMLMLCSIMILLSIMLSLRPPRAQACSEG
jgi:hypothetical protein